MVEVEQSDLYIRISRYLHICSWQICSGFLVECKVDAERSGPKIGCSGISKLSTFWISKLATFLPEAPHRLNGNLSLAFRERGLISWTFLSWFLFTLLMRMRTFAKADENENSNNESKKVLASNIHFLILTQYNVPECYNSCSQLLQYDQFNPGQLEQWFNTTIINYHVNQGPRDGYDASNTPSMIVTRLHEQI